MLEFLVEFKWAIILIIVCISMLILRKELNKLIDWIVNFKRVSKTKDGYSASTATESAGTDDIPPLSDKKQLAIEETEDSKHESNEPDTDWTKPFFDKDYPRACKILGDLISQEKDPQEKTEHRANLGYVMFEQNKQKGIEYFDELISTGDNAAKIYLWYGMSLFWNGDYPKASDVLHAGIKQHPADPELPDWLALVLQKQGEHIQAIEVLQKNINQNPTFAQSYRTLTQMLDDIDMPKQAINCCKIGMQKCPLDTRLIEKYVKILPKQDTVKERMFAYLSLTDIKPANPRYWTLLGNECLMLGFHDLALEAYHKGNTLAKEKETWILENIGNIMNNKGFYSRGAEFLKRAVSIDPNSQYGHERLGQALKNASDQQAKRDEIRKEVKQSIQDEGTLDSLLKQVQKKLSQQPYSEDSSETTESV